MTYQLLKQDGSWQAALWLALIFAVAGMWAQDAKSIVVMPLAMFMVTFGAGVAQAQGRATAFLAGLPIRKTEIFRARVLALLVLIWLPTLLAACLTAMAGKYGLGPFVGMGAVAMPVVLITQSLLIRDIRIPKWASAVIMAVVMAGFSLSMSFFPGEWKVPVVSVLSMSMTLSVAIYIQTIAAIASTADRQRVPLRRQVARHEFRAIRARFPWWLIGWWDLIWVVLGFQFGLTGPWTNGLLFLWSGILQHRERSRRLDSLPVSRRILMLAMIFPPILAVAAGYVVGVNTGFGANWRSKVYVTAGRAWPPTMVTSSCATLNVSPPLDYWRPASAPLEIQAPWGETYRPPLVRVDSTEVYNPYGVGCENTHRFLDWQYERASVAVYGKLVPKNDAGITAQPRLQTQILTVEVIFLLGLLAVFPMLLLDWWRFRRFPAPFRYTVFGVIGLAFAVFAFAPLFNRRRTGSLPDDLVQWLSWHLPENVIVVMAVGLLAPLISYFAMERMFRASELEIWGTSTTGNYN